MDGKFVGRRSELEFLSSRLAQAADGRLRVAVVEGEAGVGKTTLLRRFTDRLAPTAVCVLSASGDDAESSMAFATLSQLFASAPGCETGRVPVRPPTGPDQQEAMTGGPLRVGADLVRLAGQVMTRDRTLVIVIDDVQWMDEPSYQALAFALRRLRTDPVLCVLALRSSTPTPTPTSILMPTAVESGSVPGARQAPLPDSLRRVVAELADRLVLGGLDVADLRELAAALSPQPASAKAVARVHALTGGNALYARALLEELPAEALAGDTGPLPAPRSFALLVAARLAGCPESAQRLAAAAGVLGVSCRLSDAAAVAELDAPLAALDAAVAAGLLVERASVVEHRIAFTHPLVRAAVYHDLGPARRSALHLRAAFANEDPMARLGHRVRAAVVADDALAGEVSAAAWRQADQGLWLTAADLLLAASKLSTGRERRERTFVDALDCLIHAGDVTGAAHLLEAGPAIESPARRHFLDGRLAMVRGMNSEAEAELGRAWAAVDRVADRQLARATAEQTAMLVSGLGRPAEAAIWAYRAERLGPAPGRPSVLLDTLLFALTASGRLTDALRLADTLPRPADGVSAASASPSAAAVASASASGASPAGAPTMSVPADGLCARGALLGALGRLPEAREALSFAVAVHSKGGRSTQYGITALVFLSDVEYQLGAWDDAAVHAELARSVAADTGQEFLVPMCQAIAAYPAAAQGLPTARRYIRAAWEMTAGGDVIPRAVVHMARARLAQAAGDHTGVVEALKPLPTACVGEIAEPSWLSWCPVYAEALAALGRTEEADKHLTDYERGAHERGHGPAMVASGRVRAAIEVARGSNATAEDVYTRTVELAGEVPTPFERALLEFDYGRFLRRTGRRAGAVAALEAAQSRLAALAAAPYLARCERELAACGRIPRARRPARAVDALTPQELTVTRLATRGLSNREIAAELVLSVKTIEYHLGNVYAKLDLRSRGQLAAALRPELARADLD